MPRHHTPPPAPIAQPAPAPLPPGHFLAWSDDSPKTTTARRIADACAVFAERCGVAPTALLVNPDALPIPTSDVPKSITSVRVRATIGRCVVWVGMAETEDAR